MAWRDSRRGKWLALAVLLSVALSSARVLADDNQAARVTFEAGVEASRAQLWDEARVQFEQSLALVPKPSTMFNLALAYLKLGMGRPALEQLDAFERAATPSEHAAMLERSRVLRPQAQALVDSEQAKARSGGNVLSRAEDGLSPEARKDVLEARDAYAKGRDKQALEAFERAYRRSKRPELLYNIGVVADRLRNDRRAISAYDQFVAALPDAREAAVAQVRSESLRVALEREDQDRSKLPAPTLAPAQEAAPAPSLKGPRTLLVTGTVLSAAGLGTLIASVVTRHLFSKDWQTCLNSPVNVPCQNLDRIQRQKNVNTVGLIASPIILAAGIVLTTVGAVQLRRRKQRASFALLPTISERAAMLTVVGSF